MPEDRRLAAIMFTDLVGYSAVMVEDEKRGMEMIEQYNSIQNPLIYKFNGVLSKEIGDGTLTIFRSVFDAVCCAHSILDCYKKESGISIRIGLHLGEIIFDRGDVFGNGINIASRIQDTANPNSILISEAVFLEINNKKGFYTRFIDKKGLKNIKDPLNLYEVYNVDNSLLEEKKRKSKIYTITKQSKSPFISIRFTISPGEIIAIILAIYILYLDLLNKLTLL